jgi:hypothetical protein
VHLRAAERVSSAAHPMKARNVLCAGLAKCAISIPDHSISSALAFGAERGEIPPNLGGSRLLFARSLCHLFARTSSSTRNRRDVKRL